jgi:hypothetical protein
MMPSKEVSMSEFLTVQSSTPFRKPEEARREKMFAFRIVALVVLGFGVGAKASPNGEPPLKEEHSGLRARAKVSPDTARATALAKATGRIQSQELEEENGRLVYSFDIKVPHRSGVQEVQVDAMTGEVVSVKHESAKGEAQEVKSKL